MYSTRSQRHSYMMISTAVKRHPFSGPRTHTINTSVLLYYYAQYQVICITPSQSRARTLNTAITRSYLHVRFHRRLQLILGSSLQLIVALLPPRRTAACSDGHAIRRKKEAKKRNTNQPSTQVLQTEHITGLSFAAETRR